MEAFQSFKLGFVFSNSSKAPGNSIPLWVVEVAPVAAWSIGHGALVSLPHAPCPIPHAQKLHPFVGRVFHTCNLHDSYLISEQDFSSNLDKTGF